MYRKLKRIRKRSFTPYQKKRFRDVTTIGKFIEISVLNKKGTVLNNMFTQPRHEQNATQSQFLSGIELV